MAAPRHAVGSCTLLLLPLAAAREAFHGYYPASNLSCGHQYATTPVRYLRHSEEGELPEPGLNHRLTQLFVLLVEARWTRRVALVPRLLMSRRHGEDKNNSMVYVWPTYVDMSALGCRAASAQDLAAVSAPAGLRLPSVKTVKAYGVSTEYILERVFRGQQFHHALKPYGFSSWWYPTYRQLRCAFSYSQFIKEAARPVLERLPDNYAAMHVRRTDYIVRHPKHGVATQPQFLWRSIRQYVGGSEGRVRLDNFSLFLMSDEPMEGAYTTTLRRIASRQCPACQVQTIASLLQSSTPTSLRDNFVRFAVEAQVLAHAAVRMGTWASDFWTGSPGHFDFARHRGEEDGPYVKYALYLDRSKCQDGGRTPPWTVPPRSAPALVAGQRFANGTFVCTKCAGVCGVCSK